MDQFYNFKYKDFWIKNHTKNSLLNDKSCWELNMLWSEKIQFVKETTERKYFDTEYYGWCDIGYFRNRENLDLHTSFLSNWANNNVISVLPKDKIMYSFINTNKKYLQYIKSLVQNKNNKGLPKIPILPTKSIKRR
jgi:hypothetical protein